ncbi:MAG TPA: VOC family protein, partial [Alphaproteobacteria bacterium]|nr:VOC family protein [Alphaproteobacteria bacterium]
FGLENALLPIGGNFLEIVAPVEENTAAGRYLERRRGNGGYMVILQCGDALKERNRITGLGIRAVWTHDDDQAVATHFHPADVGGAILSIDSMAAAEDWHEEFATWIWAGPDWRPHVKTNVTGGLVGLELQSSDPDGMAQTWSRVLGRPATGHPLGGARIALDNALLRFVADEDGRGPGCGGIDIRPHDRPRIMAEADRRGLVIDDDRIMLCGVRVNLL